MAITTNVYERVFLLKYGDSLGTCFTIDIEKKQYVVTAQHVVPGLKTGDVVQLKHAGAWQKINVKLIGHSAAPADVTVFAVDSQIAHPYPLPADMDNIMYGQDVYFLGYPFGLTGDIGTVGGGRTMPFVRKGILSNLEPLTPNSPYPLLHIDGHGNRGFSGGPVVFSTAPHDPRKLKVAAVISAAGISTEPVYQGQQKTGMTYHYNYGIVQAHPIMFAMDMIKANPNGLSI